MGNTYFAQQKHNKMKFSTLIALSTIALLGNTISINEVNQEAADDNNDAVDGADVEVSETSGDGDCDDQGDGCCGGNNVDIDINFNVNMGGAGGDDDAEDAED